MRTFLAISVPEEIKKAAADVSRQLAGMGSDVKWVESYNYHLTVKFLGDIPAATVKEIRNQMHMAGEICPQFELIMNGIGFFPNQLRPRVIWLAMGGELKKASFLGRQVDDRLNPLGFETEKNHRFHLTLGRIRSQKGLAPMLKRVEAIKLRPFAFTVADFHLMESTLLPKGPIYKIIDSFSLNG